MTQHQLTPEQAAVFRGVSERFSYPINDAQGDRHVYRCEALGMTRSTLVPKRRTKHRSAAVSETTVWFLDDDGRTFHSLAQVADAILDKRKREQRAEAVLRAQCDVPETSRCGHSHSAASVS